MLRQLPPPSEEFMEAIIHSSSIVQDCTLCGRTHFNGEASSYDEGEFEELIEKHKKDPDKYVFHSNTDSVRWGNIGKEHVVYGCQCNKARAYENLFWGNRNLIADYFSRRAEKERLEAERNVGLAKNVSEALEPI